MSENPKNNLQGEPRGEDAGMGSRSRDKDYKVGYGKPPKHTRFAKGQSGNPRGRPRKRKAQPMKLSDAPSDGYLAEEAYRLIELLENGEKIELPALQAVVRAMAVSALKGNRLSQKYFLEYVARQEEQHLQLKVQNYVRLETIKLAGEKTLADHERRGLPPPDLVPHPDDIVLDPETSEARINGPKTREEVGLYEHQAQLRDLGLLYSAHADRNRGKEARRRDDSVCAYGVFAHLLNHYLPRRYQWREHEPVMLMMEYKGLTRRERERRMETESARLEATRPRLSRVTPEMEEGIDRIVRKLLKPREDAPAGQVGMPGDG